MQMGVVFLVAAVNLAQPRTMWEMSLHEELEQPGLWVCLGQGGGPDW